ncbi:MAG: hypothetical protein MK116_13710 [Phycisphaerales bacterium]|nr:hypothetical protein [Phycisphaerales bacterium]
MPMPRWRRWYRGVDHARLLADAVARRLGLEVCQPLRKRAGVPQAALSRTGRSRSAAGDYRLLRSGSRGFGGRLANLEGANLILVDDVLTTGRSIRAAGTLLERLGPALVVAAVLAVTEQRDPVQEAESGIGPSGPVDKHVLLGTLAGLPSRPATGRRSVLP